MIFIHISKSEILFRINLIFNKFFVGRIDFPGYLTTCVDGLFGFMVHGAGAINLGLFQILWTTESGRPKREGPALDGTNGVY